jgi:predicted ATPase/DNA-binding CsgD family transcriptional regulator
MRRTDSRSGGNLPAEISSFIGRTQELGEIKRLLTASRLVTLTGLGGVGKTRLALHTAEQVRRAFPDGVWFVDLTSLRAPERFAVGAQDPEGLAYLVMTALGLREQVGGPPPTRQLVGHLAGRHSLLVLDNCERLLPVCALLAGTLLRDCPRLRIMATSRELLLTTGEAIYSVPPLPTPRSGAQLRVSELGRYEAVALFVARAQAVAPGFTLAEENAQAVAELCRRLDGLPLAIELAAAQVRVLNPPQILDRLAQRFALLTRGSRNAPGRQQTLRACVDWSFELCAKPERVLWARLSVFAGGFELDAVEGVCADEQLPQDHLLDVVAGLIDKSILISDGSRGISRYRMLETLRDYGQEMLIDDAEADELRRRHQNWYERLVLQAHADWCSPRQADWFARLDREYPNVQAAMSYCLSEPGMGEAALRMLTALYYFYCWGRGRYREGRGWIDQALALETRPSALRATILFRDACLAEAVGDVATARARRAEGRALTNQFGDPALCALAEYATGLVAYYRGKLGLSLACADRGMTLLPEGENVPLRLDFFMLLVIITAGAGDEQRATVAFEQARLLAEPASEAFHRSNIIWAFGLLAFQQGKFDQAAQLNRDSLPLRQVTGDVLGIGWSVESLAWIAAAVGRHQHAATLLGVSDRIWETTGFRLESHQELLQFHDECERRAREALGDEQLQSTFEHGRSLGFDEAMRYALDDNLEIDRATAPRPRSRPTAPADPGLTRREWEVAELIATGRSNKDIAEALVISPRTAESHTEHILTKLGFTSRSQVAAWITVHHSNTYQET